MACGVAPFKTASGTGGCVIYAVESNLCSSCMMLTNTSFIGVPSLLMLAWILASRQDYRVTTDRAGAALLPVIAADR
jgi:hypothetical protein